MTGTLLGPIDNLKKFDMHYKERECLEALHQHHSADSNSLC